MNEGVDNVVPEQVRPIRGGQRRVIGQIDRRVDDLEAKLEV